MLEEDVELTASTFINVEESAVDDVCDDESDDVTLCTVHVKVN